MADIRVTKSRTKCVFTALSPAGLTFLQKQLGQEPAVRDIEHMEDIIEHLQKEGLIVEY